MVGLLAGNGYLFWAGRRSEIIGALTAVSLLGDELRSLISQTALTGNSPDRGKLETAQLASTWGERRAALVPVMHPADLQALSKALALYESSRPQDLTELLGWVDGITRVLWRDLQTIIFTGFLWRRLTLQGSLITQIRNQREPAKRVPLTKKRRSLPWRRAEAGPGAEVDPPA